MGGFFYPEHFGPAGRSLCIKLDKKDKSSWISPIEFEKKSGKGAQHNWKRTIRSTSHDNKMLWYLLDEKILNACLDKHCQCTRCRRSREGLLTPATSSPKTSLEDAIKVPSTSVKSEKQRDTDSDSGISVEISNVTSLATPIPSEPLSTREQEKPLPNYTLMVQEAIVSLTTGDKNKDVNGCSLLGIFLYILHNYSMLESVEVMNEKIRSTLALLKRMGIVERVDTDTEHDNDELEMQKKFKKSESKKTASKPTLMAKKKVAKLIASSKKTGKENANTSQVVVQKAKRLSPALATICGRKLLNRHEALKAIWKYIKKHDLQGPSQRTIIVCDDKLKAVTKKKRVTSSEILTCLGSNMTTL